MLELDEEKIANPEWRATVRKLIEFFYLCLTRPSVPLAPENLKHSIYLATMPMAATLLAKTQGDSSYEEIFRFTAENSQRISDLFLEVMVEKVTEGMASN